MVRTNHKSNFPRAWIKIVVLSLHKSNRYSSQRFVIWALMPLMIYPHFCQKYCCNLVRHNAISGVTLYQGAPGSKFSKAPLVEVPKVRVERRICTSFLQSGAKIMGLFTFLAIFKYVGLPPPPMINVGEIGLNFLFSVIHTTLNWG